MKLKKLSSLTNGRVKLVKKANPEPVIQRIEFLKSDFEDQDSVQAVLDEKYEMEGVTILEKADRFVVVDSPSSKFLKLENIGSDVEGMVIFAGELKPVKKVAKADKAKEEAVEDDADAAEEGEDADADEDAEEDAEDADADDAESDSEDADAETEEEEEEVVKPKPEDVKPVVKAKGKKEVTKDAPATDATSFTPKAKKLPAAVADRIKKFDSWSVGTAAKTIEAVIAASEDKGPLGLNELQAAMRVGLRNVFMKSDDVDGEVDGLITEYGDYLRALVGVWKSAPTKVKKAEYAKELLGDDDEETPTKSTPAVKVKKQASALLEVKESASDSATRKELAALKELVIKMSKSLGQSPAPVLDEDEDGEDANEEDEDGEDNNETEGDDRGDPFALQKMLNARCMPLNANTKKRR